MICLQIASAFGTKRRRLSEFILANHFRGIRPPPKSTEEMQAWMILATAKSNGEISQEVKDKAAADLKAYSDMVDREVAKARAKGMKHARRN